MRPVDEESDECPGSANTKISIGGNVVCGEQAAELSLALSGTTAEGAMILADPIKVCEAPLDSSLVELQGKILVAEYGKCDDKVQRAAEDAGASGLIFINPQPWTHSIPGDWSDTGIPVVMVSSQHRAVLKPDAGHISIFSSKYIPHLAWWWFVAAGDSPSFKLNSSTFDNTALQVFETCEFRIAAPRQCDPIVDKWDGKCCGGGDSYKDCCNFPRSQIDDVRCSGCGGDYKDCCTAAPPAAQPSSVGRLLQVLSAGAKIEIRGCKVVNLGVESAAKLGIVNSTFDPQLNETVPTLRAPDECSTNKLCDPRSKCEEAPAGPQKNIYPTKQCAQT